MDLGMGLGIECVFTAEVFDKDGVVETIGPFKNIVLDVGLLKLYDYSIYDMTTYVNVGTSRTDASAEQTGLLARLYSTSNIFNNQKFSGYSAWPVYRSYTKVFQWDIGTCTGEFNEVGLSRAANVDYFNRQKFKNSDGYYVTVRVLADQGLRITCELRLSPDPLTKVYSKVYELNLQGNTAGTITFTDGTTTKTLTYAELTTGGSAKSAFETWLGVGKVTNYVLVNNKYYILFHPLNTSDIVLSIQSHTLTGGGGAPSLTLIQPFANAAVDSSFPFDDVTNGGVTTKATKRYYVLQIASMNLITMLQAAASATEYGGWGAVPNGTNADIMQTAFKNLAIKAITQAPALPAPTLNQVVSTPSAGDIGWTKRCYYAPAALGTGTQIVTGYTLYVNGSDSQPVLCIVKLVDPISVPAAEEFEFNFKLKWGRP